MILFKSAGGAYLVEITSAEPEKILKEIALSGISITKVFKKSQLVYRFNIASGDYPSICSILQKRHSKIVIVSRHGIIWSIQSLLRRPVLLCSVIAILLLTFYLPTRILFFETGGNQMLSDNALLDAAESCGLSFGASRKTVRSEKVKNQLLSALPQLQWAGINTAGCRAVISVRERIEQKETSGEHEITNLISHLDAYILSATATRGTPLVHAGDTVIKGQTLISGYTDHGLLIKAEQASGEVWGLTRREITALKPKNQRIIAASGVPRYKISLLLRKKRINLWKDSRISDAGCGRMYKEYFISLPGGYKLPFAVCIDQYFIQEIQSDIQKETAIYPELQQFSDTYLLQQMVAGQILRSHQEASESDEVYYLKSYYTCSELISREQREQIGDHNGKRN